MPLNEHRLGFIGAGNMAEAIVRGLISASVTPAEHIYASDVHSDRLDAFSALGVNAFPDNAHVVAEADTLILSIKPQIMAEVLAELRPHINPSTLVISIAAGVKTSTIEEALADGVRVVRVMPNTPLLVGKGMSVLTAGKNAAEDDMALASEIFAASGEVMPLKDEALMDAVTAVSGSGPAYVFYLAEAMLKAAAAEGLPEDMAESLVRFTIQGAGVMLAASVAMPPTELRRRVTSPGGTTEAAVRLMDDAGTMDTLVQAVRRAAEKGRELGKGS